METDAAYCSVCGARLPELTPTTAGATVVLDVGTDNEKFICDLCVRRIRRAQ